MLESEFSVRSESPAFAAGELFVGIDVAKNRHCARAVNSLDGRKSSGFFFDNRRKGFLELIEQIAKWLRKFACSTVVVGMEPTAGYWEPLFGYLSGAGFEVKLVSSLKVKRSKDLMDNSPLKSDEKDALLIAQLVAQGNVIELKRTDETLQIRKLVKHAEDLDKTRSVHLNLVEHFLSVHFPEFGDVFKDLGSPTALAALREFPFPKDAVSAGLERVEEVVRGASRGRTDIRKAAMLVDLAAQSIGIPERTDAERTVLMHILDVLDMVERLQRTTKAMLAEKLESIPAYEILRSVKGIGVMTAAAIIAALGDLSDYRNARQVLKKVGLNLYRFSSGKHRGTDRISRRGMALLRKHLFMAALSTCRPGGIFHEKYKSMTNRHVARKKAVVAIMRKLLKLLYALVRDNRRFETEYMPGRAKSDVCVIKQAAA